MNVDIAALNLLMHTSKSLKYPLLQLHSYEPKLSLQLLFPEQGLGVDFRHSSILSEQFDPVRPGFGHVLQPLLESQEPSGHWQTSVQFSPQYPG